MGSLRHPVGDQPPQVYWVRRVLVLVAAAVVIAALWFIVSSALSSEDGAGTGAEPEESVSPDATSSADAAALNDPSQPCTADDVTITAVASPASPTIGTMPAFDLSIEHTGITACTLSTDSEGTELAISSGADQYYSTVWCPQDPGFESKTWVLQPEGKEALQVTWPGTWRTEDCSEERGEVKPGTYQAAVSIGGIPAEVVSFSMVE
ncbi:hypothetical protein ON058_02295 [Demequina sp. B12]|uniref:hypothetical protein n=1 Tax=Demequina sp. B12 TaxID=2992757 RepID=UPI00237C088F|nr:hypothetical protein [Demequina sp. B12]MDE0572242.1 hypothetical protein [Demequina sp. B12]